MTEYKIIDILQSRKSHHEEVFVCQVGWSALEELLASMLQDNMGIHNALEPAKAQVAGTRNLAGEIAKVLVSDSAILALIGTYVVKVANKAVSQAWKLENRAAPPFSPLSGFDGWSYESKKDRSKESKKTLWKIRYRCKSWRASAGANVWSLARLSKKSDVSSCQENVENKNCTLKLPTLLITNSHFGNVANYQTYWIVNKLQRYYAQQVVRKGKCVRRMESTVVPSIVSNYDPGSIHRFLDQFNWSCGSNGVSKRMELYILSNFAMESSSSSFSSLLVSIGVRRDLYARPRDRSADDSNTEDILSNYCNDSRCQLTVEARIASYMKKATKLLGVNRILK